MSRLVSVARIMAFAALLALPSAARAAIVDYDVEGLGQSVVDMGVVTAGYEGLVNTVDAVHAVPNDDGYCRMYTITTRRDFWRPTPN